VSARITEGNWTLETVLLTNSFSFNVQERKVKGQSQRCKMLSLVGSLLCLHLLAADSFVTRSVPFVFFLEVCKVNEWCVKDVSVCDNTNCISRLIILKGFGFNTAWGGVEWYALTCWRRNYFLNFSTPCIQNVNNTGTIYVRIMKQTAFWREKNWEYTPCLKYSVPIFVE